MKYVFNIFTGTLDVIEDHFGTGGIFLTDSDGNVWQVTVDTTGALVTTLIVPPVANVWLPLGLSNMP